MKRDNGQGIFTMDFINTVSRMKALEEAKVAAQKLIADSTANSDNKQKASAMVTRATNLRALLLGMSNFSLSHQGLSVK